MNSFRCPQCGLLSFVTARACIRCKIKFDSISVGVSQNHENSNTIDDSASFALAQNYHSTQSSNYQPFNAEKQNFTRSIGDLTYQNHSSSQIAGSVTQKTGLALTSMIIGIVGIFVCWGFFGIGSLIGVVLGVIALIKINKNPVEYGGKRFAVAGTVLNSLLLVSLIPMISIMSAIAIPNFLAARKAANEASAISNLRSLIVAESTFMKDNNNQCGDLKELVRKGLIDSVLANGERSGYSFTVTKKQNGNCDLNATPQSESTGSRSFYVSTVDGEIRGATKSGLPADSKDPVLRLIKPAASKNGLSQDY